MPMKQSALRRVAKTVVMDCGFKVQDSGGQGRLPNSRFLAVRNGKRRKMAVKALSERALSFTRQPSRRWRTLSFVDYVVAITPTENDHAAYEVLAFKKAALVSAFNKAWTELKSRKRLLSYKVPIFIPLDKTSRKNVGHGVANLKKLAFRRVPLTAEETGRRSLVEDDNYIDEFRARFAKENNVDIDQVLVSILAARK